MSKKGLSKTIKIDEAKLNRIIKESVASVLGEAEITQEFTANDSVMLIRELAKRLRAVINEFSEDDDFVYKIKHQIALVDSNLSSDFLHYFYNIDEGIDALNDIAFEVENEIS